MDVTGDHRPIRPKRVNGRGMEEEGCDARRWQIKTATTVANVEYTPPKLMTAARFTRAVHGGGI
jgi:hypothetical protein